MDALGLSTLGDELYVLLEDEYLQTNGDGWVYLKPREGTIEARRLKKVRLTLYSRNNIKPTQQKKRIILFKLHTQKKVTKEFFYKSMKNATHTYFMLYIKGKS